MPELAKRDHCTGCTACTAVCPKDAITMEPDVEGFRYPVVAKDKCVGCGLCQRACPVLNPIALTHTPSACAAKSPDEASRMASTSGGVFTELARDVLARGGAVFGAAYDDRFRVVHICAEDETNLVRLRGAKYAQSDLVDSFREVKRRLDKGQPILFSGTPCQVLGLRSYLRWDYDNLLLVDLVCHSVPSPLVWEKYLEYISAEKTLTAVNLRCKDTGWSHYAYSNRFDFSDGSSRLDRSGDSLYMKLFVGGQISRPSCTNCPAKGYARGSDLTLGDFWGIWDIAPELDDDRGTSLVLIQTVKGRAAMSCLDTHEVTLEEASRSNSAILRATAENPMHHQTMALVRKGNFDAAARLLPVHIPQKAPRLLHWVLKLLKRKVWNG